MPRACVCLRVSVSRLFTVYIESVAMGTRFPQSNMCASLLILENGQPLLFFPTGSGAHAHTRDGRRTSSRRPCGLEDLDVQPCSRAIVPDRVLNCNN